MVRRLAAGWMEAGGEVHVGAVVEPEAVDHPFVERMQESTVPLDVLRVPHRAYLTEARDIARLVDKVEPDLVHTHGYRADVLAGTVARRKGLTTVSTVHGFTGGGWKNRVYEWLQMRALTRCDAVVAVSEPLTSELLGSGVSPSRLHVIRNAWTAPYEVLSRAEAREQLGLPDDAFIAGWVGRLSREKAADVFIRALARLDGDHVLGSVIGAGTESEELKHLARRLGLGRRVRFHGQISGAASLYRAFDAFVLSSRTEGTPISLFESMEAGVPIVATTVGGVPDVLGDGEAVLVPPEDSTAIAKALQSIRDHPDAAERRTRKAHRRLKEEFAPDPWIERYENIYREARSGQ